MAFIEERLLDRVSYGTVMMPTWRTRKIPLRSGITRRNPLRSRPLYRFSVVYRNLLPIHHMEVVHAFNACYAGVHSFRIKDWSDYEAFDEPFQVTGTGSPQTLQLAKTYTFGTQSILRPIRKPVSGTVIIKAGGTPISATVDYTTGMATFTASNGSVLTWSGEFDVPVMFEEDQLPFSGDDKGQDGLFLNADVPLIEDVSV